MQQIIKQWKAYKDSLAREYNEHRDKETKKNNESRKELNNFWAEKNKVYAQYKELKWWQFQEKNRLLESLNQLHWATDLLESQLNRRPHNSEPPTLEGFMDYLLQAL
jgi:hypothetical protein